MAISRSAALEQEDLIDHVIRTFSQTRTPFILRIPDKIEKIRSELLPPLIKYEISRVHDELLSDIINNATIDESTARELEQLSVFPMIYVIPEVDDKDRLAPIPTSASEFTLIPNDYTNCFLASGLQAIFAATDVFDHLFNDRPANPAKRTHERVDDAWNDARYRTLVALGTIIREFRGSRGRKWDFSTDLYRKRLSVAIDRLVSDAVKARTQELITLGLQSRIKDEITELRNRYDTFRWLILPRTGLEAGELCDTNDFLRALFEVIPQDRSDAFTPTALQFAVKNTMRLELNTNLPRENILMPFNINEMIENGLSSVLGAIKHQYQWEQLQPQDYTNGFLCRRRILESLPLAIGVTLMRGGQLGDVDDRSRSQSVDTTEIDAELEFDALELFESGESVIDALYPSSEARDRIEKYKYSLVSLVTWKGGHYTVSISRGPDEWYHVNGDRVSKTDNPLVKGSSAEAFHRYPRAQAVMYLYVRGEK
jgi:hypothetical protein